MKPVFSQKRQFRPFWASLLPHDNVYKYGLWTHLENAGIGRVISIQAKSRHFSPHDMFKNSDRDNVKKLSIFLYACFN
jgi:hypothetical protein